MTSKTPKDRAWLAASHPFRQTDRTALVVSAIAAAVAIGYFVGTVAAATTVVGFEEFDDGTELTDQYRDGGVTFEAQENETAGAIVETCEPESAACTSARDGQNVIRTPIEVFEVQYTHVAPPIVILQPLVAVFEEPQEEVWLYVREMPGVNGTQTAQIVARDASGENVDRTAISFDAGTGWHRIAVSTPSPEISAIELTLMYSAIEQEPHNRFLVDDLTFRTNQPPTPVFDHVPEDPTPGELITFNASESTDPDGELVEFRWDFDGDELVDSTGRTATTAFEEPGTYSVTLAVEDDAGRARTVTQDVTVEAEPVAWCSVSETNVARGEQVTIDASASTNAERVLFDIDGDGIYDRTNEGDFSETASYDESGRATPAVRVEAGELSDTRSCPTLRVNRPPTAAIAAPPTTPTVGESVALDASRSTDADGKIVEYRWDFDGDGSPNRTTASPWTNYTFDERGSHRVSVAVVDDHEAVDLADTSIRVNGLPRVVLGYFPATVEIDYPYVGLSLNYAPVDDLTVGEPIAFDASGTSDADGEIEAYRWDFDGDGSPDRTTATPRTTYTFREGGSHTVSLTVVDDDGGVDRAQTPVRVGEPTVPGPVPGSDGIVGIIGGGVAMLALRHRPGSNGQNEYEENGENRPPDARIEFVPQKPTPGRPVVLDGSRSSDPDSGDRIVSYRWAIDGTTAMAPRFVHVFPVAGEYDVELVVTDNHGATGTHAETITVGEPEGELALDRVLPGVPDDGGALDREYVVFENSGERRLDLGGWTVRDAAATEGRVVRGEHAFEFPDGFSLDPGATVTVHTGPEPADWKPNGVEGGGGEQHLFWGEDRAVWDARTDVVVVEDGGGHPVMAVRYERTGPGEYDFDHLDVEILQHWFPDVVVSSRGEAPAVNVSVDVDAGDLVPSVVSSTRALIAGALLLRGPRQFLHSWVIIAGFFLVSSVSWGVSTWAGIVSRSVGVYLPFYFLPAAVSVLLVGRVAVSLWLGISTLWRRIT